MVSRCSRCRHKYRGRGEWNVIAQQGRVVGFLCLDCQTPA